MGQDVLIGATGWWDWTVSLAPPRLLHTSRLGIHQTCLSISSWMLMVSFYCCCKCSHWAIEEGFQSAFLVVPVSFLLWWKNMPISAPATVPHSLGMIGCEGGQEGHAHTSVSLNILAMHPYKPKLLGNISISFDIASTPKTTLLSLGFFFAISEY